MLPSVRSLRAASLAAVILVAGAPFIDVHAAAPAAPAAPAAASASEKKVDQIAARFYDTRARFDPMLYATANGDSRYDDQLGMAIDPKVIKRYQAANHGFLKQLKAIDRMRLSDKARLNYDILAAEIQAPSDHALDARRVERPAHAGQGRDDHVDVFPVAFVVVRQIGRAHV